ncbi:MAG: DUF262 domain-containing protein [Rhodospirillales bacterium]
MADENYDIHTLEDEEWNDDIIEELDVSSESEIIVFSRDWTVETILSQISKGNINLNPKFQRRNAWNDTKRSRLIESLLLGVPIPEIILAEQPNKKKAYVVVDGKQRLLAIAGFINPDVYGSWEKPVLSKLINLSKLNKLSYSEMSVNGSESEVQRSIMNSPMRCTIISHYASEDVLYDIFNRINSGSVPLSTQELRQALHAGDFSNFLVEYTNEERPIHEVLGSKGADRRLRDAELLLRYLAICLTPETYHGALKQFLDDATIKFNNDWVAKKGDIYQCLRNSEIGCARLIKIFGDAKRVGRKHLGTKWEGRFNKSLFEAQLFYMSHVPQDLFSQADLNEYLKDFKTLCTNDHEFVESISSTTKTKTKFEKRFRSIMKLTNSVFRSDIDEVPIKE